MSEDPVVVSDNAPALLVHSENHNAFAGILKFHGLASISGRQAQPLQST
jgi:hypothetical protein